MVGNVRVKPRITIEGKHDSNIFLSNTLPQSAFILDAGPAIGMSVENKTLKFEAGYEFRLINYSRFQNVTNAQHHTLAASVNWEYMPDGKFGLDDLFMATTDPASSEFTQRARRGQNDLGVMFDVPFGSKLFIGGRMKHTIVDYQTTALSLILDRNELLAGGRVGYQIGPKTKLYGYARASNIGYWDNKLSNSNGTLAGAGIEGKISERITGQVEVGAISRKYSQTISGEPSEFNTGSTSVNVDWSAPRGFKVSVNANRNSNESAYARYNIGTNGGISVTKGIGKAWEAQILGSYGQDNYPNAKPDPTTLVLKRRVDTNFAAGVRLSYQLYAKNKLSLKYMHRGRSSNFDVYNYTDGVATLSTEYSF